VFEINDEEVVACQGHDFGDRWAAKGQPRTNHGATVGKSFFEGAGEFHASPASPSIATPK
jgi:hypothetical protein